MDSDCSSEEEVFFGPVTDKEKKIAARYHGRKTLILPQRNPLYHRWSTTHIPSAFITRDDSITTASSSNSTTTSQCMSQDYCSSTSMLPSGSPAGSQPLSCDGGEDSYFSAFTESHENPCEAGHEDVNPLTMTNSSCYSSMGGLADDERSVYSIKLDNVLSPVSQSKNNSKLMEAIQLQEPCVVPTSPQDSMMYNNTGSTLSDYPATCIVIEESNQQSNFSSPKILQYDSSLHSLAIPTGGSNTSASMTVADLKPFYDCPRELCGSLKELSIKYREHDCSLRESHGSFQEPLASPTQPKYTFSKLQYNPEVPDCIKPGDGEPSNSPRKLDDCEPHSRPRKLDDSEPSITLRRHVDSEPTICTRKCDDSEPSRSPREFSNSKPSICARNPDSNEPSCSPRKPGDDEPSSSPRKPYDSEPSTCDRKSDSNEPFSSPRKPDDSELCSISRKPDDSESLSSPRKPGNNDPFNSRTKPDDSKSFSNPTKPGNSEPCSSLLKPDDSELSSNPGKLDNSEPFSSFPKLDSTACESNDSLLDPSFSLEESVGCLRVPGSNLSKSPTSLEMHDSSPRELSSLSHCPASPRFNDTLEEIEQFLKYGVDYGEKGVTHSDGTQRHSTTPTHHSRDSECSPRMIACCTREPFGIRGDMRCITDESDKSFVNRNGKPKEPDHSIRELSSFLTDPESNLVKPSPYPQKLDNGLRELSASCSSAASPRFDDTQEEIEQFLEYGVYYGENSNCAPSGNQGFSISSACSPCSSNFQPPLESTQASGAMTCTVDDEGKQSSLPEEEEHPRAPVSVKKTPMHSPLQAKIFPASTSQSLPPSSTTSVKEGLAQPVQLVMPTSRVPVTLSCSQPVRADEGSSVKATPTPKVVRSQPSRHTSTTSRIQPKTPRVKLELGNSVSAPIPKVAALPPHPQRRLLPRLVPKKIQASTSDGRHQRMLWHKSVASPLAKELRNNPPPPLVVNVKFKSSQNPGKWHPPSSPSSSCNLFSKGGKVQKIVEEIPSPKVCHDIKDGQVLPVANYKTGKSIIMNSKDNKENTKRQCCKPSPVHEAKVIKHTGRVMVAKPHSTLQGGHSERTSLMEVSVHQPISSD